MIKKIILLLIIVLGFKSQAQVGINTITPKAQLEIKSTNEATPANTDGLLIPKINAFPVTNPTVDQQGMLVYLTTTVGANTPGFYYWNNPTTAWLPVKGTDGGTLDQAYDFDGAGNGRTITADSGAVTIAGTDGLVSTGTLGSGALTPSGVGTRMVWNPRKAAIRAGTVSLGGSFAWDDNRVGIGSTAFGNTTQASGQYSTAFGDMAEATGYASVSFGGQNIASGAYSTAFSFGNNASGENSVAFGNGALASGIRSTAFGTSNRASGFNSTAFGQNNQAISYSETVIGIGATTYTPSTNGATQFRTANATDRLFVIGNAIDADNNNTVDVAERSDAMVVLKNGKTGFGTSLPLSNVEIVGNNVTTGASTYGNLHVRTIDNFAADVGGSITIGGAFGAGVAPLIFYRNFASIEARKTNSDLFDQNAYLIFKTLGTGALIERMRITANGDVGIGTGTPGSKLHIVGNLRMVDGNQAAGKVLTSDVNGTATWQNASANAWGLIGNTGTNSTTNFIGTTDDVNIVFKRNNIKSGTIGNTNTSLGVSSLNALSTGTNNTAIGKSALSSTSSGTGNTSVGANTFTFNMIGNNNTALGFNASTGGSPILNNATAIGAFSQVDVGNALVLGSINGVNGATSNVNVGIGTGNPLNKLHLHTNSNTENNILQFSNPGSSFTSNSGFLVGLDVSGDAGIVNNINGKIGFNNGTMLLDGDKLGIGATTPLERLHVSGRALFTNGFSSDNAALVYRNNVDYMFLGPQSGSSSNGGAMALYGSTNITGGNAGGIDFNIPGSQVRMNHTNGSYIFRANSTSGYTATFELNDVGLQIGHNSASRDVVFNTASTERMRLTAAGRVGIGTPTPGGQLELSLNEGRKPGSNAWTIVSDQRLKNVNGIFTKGLNEIIQLNPIRYNYKNNGERKFEQKVLTTEFTGFLAQEVQQIFPEAVGTDADGYLNFDLHPILVAYTNAFKELYLKNQSVENKNRELELKLKSQEEIINNLIERLEKLEAKN